MKRIFSCLICVLLLLSFLTGCKKEPEYYSEWISVYETLPADSESAEETMSNQSATTPTPSKINYPSTIATPEYINFYKGGMWAQIKDKAVGEQIAKAIEKWHSRYESETLPKADFDATKQLIWEMKQKETVIELEFGYKDSGVINFLGKIEFQKTYRILVPLTGNYAYYIFSGGSGGEYQNKPYNLKGSGLEQYFEGITLDKKVRSWESTVSAPATVTFYKDGATAVSTDKDLNREIAKHIENWFKYEEETAIAATTYTDDRINDMKRSERAIELNFDGDITFFGNLNFPNCQTLFITVPENEHCTIYHNTIKSPYLWPTPRMGGVGLERFFESVQFTPLTEEEIRWRSTVSAASEIKAYENRKIVGKTNKSFWEEDFPLKYAVMKHIESWFYKKEEISRIDVGFTDTRLNEVKSKVKYLEVKLKSEDYLFYGQELFAKDTKYIVIPLEGDYAYHIFEGDEDKNYSSIAIITEGSGLEEYFEAIKNK